MGSVRRGLLATFVAIAVLVAVDLSLSVAGVRPPDDPLLFFARTREVRVDPFAVGADGSLSIRPDWVNDGVGLRGRRGKRAGRQFLLPGFRPVRLADPKPSGTLRVVALGGSTTYGLYVGAEDAFAAVLAGALHERAVGRRVEGVNLGCPGFASDRVLALLPRALELEPDLVVVLAGHNEMLGGHVGPTAELSPALRLRAGLLRLSSLFAWWNHVLARTLRGVETERVREEAAALEAGQIPTYVPEDVPASARVLPTDAFRQRAADRFADAVAGMVSLGTRAEVPLLFAVPAANLRVPPGLSQPTETQALRVALRSGRALLESGDALRALGRLDAAVAAAPDHAGAHYARGEALLRLGREDDARTAFRRAVDLDLRTHRITTQLEAALVETLRAEGARYVDLRPLFQARLDDATAAALFVDHVHPTAEGHRRIALALLPQAAAALGLD